MIKPLTDADVPAAVAILERVELSGGAANLQRYLRWQPDGCWGWFDAGLLVGTVTVLHHQHVGFVGCMAVEPALQGRGIGRQLLVHAHAASRAAGVTTLLLEATPRGAALYASCGYVVDHETAIVGRDGDLAAPVHAPVHGERAAILALDRAATGSDRATMIGGLVETMPGAVVRTGDRLAGYGLVIDGRLGPVIASDPGAGRAIIDRLAPGCGAAAIPVPNEAALAAVLGHGFTVMRRLQRMRLGPPVPAQLGWIWTLASPGAG